MHFYTGASRSEAFLIGQQAVAETIKEQKAVTENYRIQPSMHNLMAFHNFGIID